MLAHLCNVRGLRFHSKKKRRSLNAAINTSTTGAASSQQTLPGAPLTSQFYETCLDGSSNIFHNYHNQEQALTNREEYYEDQSVENPAYGLLPLFDHQYNSDKDEVESAISEEAISTDNVAYIEAKRSNPLEYLEYQQSVVTTVSVEKPIQTTPEIESNKRVESVISDTLLERNSDSSESSSNSSSSRKPKTCAKCLLCQQTSKTEKANTTTTQKSSRKSADSRFGYNVTDITNFLSNSTFKAPANLPVVIDGGCWLYQCSVQTERRAWVSMGMVVNALFCHHNWVYVRTPCGSEGFIPINSCIPLGILSPVEKPKKKQYPEIVSDDDDDEGNDDLEPVASKFNALRLKDKDPLIKQKCAVVTNSHSGDSYVKLVIPDIASNKSDNQKLYEFGTACGKKTCKRYCVCYLSSWLEEH